jgi:hypothetical protein
MGMDFLLAFDQLRDRRLNQALLGRLDLQAIIALGVTGVGPRPNADW